MKQGNILHQITLALAFLMMTELLGSTTTYAQTGCEALIGAYGYSVVGLATFDNLDDGYRAVIVALANGEVREIFFRPGSPEQRGDSLIYQVLTRVTGVRITALSGYYAKDSGYRVVLVGTSNGQITEIRYHPYRPKLVRVIYSGYPQVTALSASYYNSAIYTAVALSNGRIISLAPVGGSTWTGYAYVAVEKGWFGQRILAVATYHDEGRPKFYVALEDGRIYQFDALKNTSRLFQRRYAPINSMSATAYDAFLSDLSGEAGFLLNGSRPYSSYPPITKVAAGEELWRRTWARDKFVYTDKCQP